MDRSVGPLFDTLTWSQLCSRLWVVGVEGSSRRSGRGMTNNWWMIPFLLDRWSHASGRIGTLTTRIISYTRLALWVNIASFYQIYGRCAFHVTARINYSPNSTILAYGIRDVEIGPCPNFNVTKLYEIQVLVVPWKYRSGPIVGIIDENAMP